MNITKNGIFVETLPSQRKPKIMRPYVSPFKTYITLTRIEDEHVVWTSLPYDKETVKQLKRDGWKVNEVWEVEKCHQPKKNA